MRHVWRPYPFREEVDPRIARDLKRLGVRFETGLTPETEALVTLLNVRIDAAFLDRAPAVRAVCLVAVGYDNTDLAEATRRGVIVTNTPGVLTDATADIAWALLLAAARRLGEGERMVREGRFQKWDFMMLRGTDIRGRTLGIVGGGRIGQAVAKRAKAWDMALLYTSRRRKPDFERATGARRVTLETLLARSDFVSIHVPLSAETRHLIGARQLALMKPSAILVNTARGAVIDEAALAAALKSGRIRAAGLDVYEREPQVHPGLLDLENVFLLPHLGSATEGTRRAMYETALRNCVAALQGKVPPNCLNPEVLAVARRP